MENMIALGTWIVLKIEKAKEQTDSGILLPVGQMVEEERIKRCLVLSVGADIKIDIKAGEYAYIPSKLVKGVSTELMDGSTLVITDETHIIGRD